MSKLKYLYKNKMNKKIRKIKEEIKEEIREGINIRNKRGFHSKILIFSVNN